MKRITATLLPVVLLLPPLLFATPLPVNLGEPFTLGPGQSAEVIDEDLYLVFTGVLSDTRCPLGVWCFWEGDAEVGITGDLPGEIQIDCVLHTSWQFPCSCPMGDLVVYLVLVEPYPVYGEPPIDPDDYLATFVVMGLTPVELQGKAWGSVKALYH